MKNLPPKLYLSEINEYITYKFCDNNVYFYLYTKNMYIQYLINIYNQSIKKDNLWNYFYIWYNKRQNLLYNFVPYIYKLYINNKNGFIILIYL